MLKKIAIILASLIIITLGIALMVNYSEPKVSVVKSFEINAGADTIFALIKNPDVWKKWYPLFQRDTGAKVEIYRYPSGEPKGIEWQSKTEGTGLVKFGYFIQNSEINYVLFVKELNVNSIVKILLEKKSSNKTTIKWNIESSLEDTFSGKFRAFLFRRVLDSEIDNTQASFDKIFNKDNK